MDNSNWTVGSIVVLTLKDGSILRGMVVSNGLRRGWAIKPHLSSKRKWSFRASDIENVKVLW